MKRTLVLVTVLVLAALPLFADGHGFFGTPEGDWALRGARLYQNDEEAPRAKAWMAIPQNETMIYEFTMRYQGGGDDGHGGVGIHVFGDQAPTGRSWGMGESWLLWLNYDVDPSADGVPAGLSAQIYQSTSNEDMEVVKSVSLNAYAPLLMNYLYDDIPMKLMVNPATGRVIINDPSGQTSGWYVDLPGAAGMSGNYVAVRTNGIAASFTSPDVSL